MSEKSETGSVKAPRYGARLAVLVDVGEGNTLVLRPEEAGQLLLSLQRSLGPVILPNGVPDVPFGIPGPGVAGALDWKGMAPPIREQLITDGPFDSLHVKPYLGDGVVGTTAGLNAAAHSLSEALVRGGHMPPLDGSNVPGLEPVREGTFRPLGTRRGAGRGPGILKVEDLRGYLGSGNTLAEVAEAYGLPEAKVRNMAVRYRLVQPMRSMKTLLDIRHIEPVRKGLQDGMTFGAVGKALNVSKSTVQAFVARNGLGQYRRRGKGSRPNRSKGGVRS